MKNGKQHRKAAVTQASCFVVAIIAIIAITFFVLDKRIDNEPVGTGGNLVQLFEDQMQMEDTYTVPDIETLDGPYDIERVVDGDTIYIINAAGEGEKIRFIGVDTPESVNPDASKNTEEGKIASDYSKQVMTGQKVWLEYDIDHTDNYDRTLAYVYIADGEDMVMMQDVLLANGYAKTMTIQPNSKYADHFASIQAEARETGAGFWGDYSQLFEERSE